MFILVYVINLFLFILYRLPTESLVPVDRNQGSCEKPVHSSCQPFWRWWMAR